MAATIRPGSQPGGILSKQRLKNWTPEHVAGIRRGIDNGFARLRRRRDLLLSFFRHAGLSVNQLW